MRKPDRTIHHSDGSTYLQRWYIIPRNRWCNIYLHCFKQSDDDRALHDHPWWSVSFNIKGDLYEVYEWQGWVAHLWETHIIQRRIRRYWPYYRSSRHAHVMQLVSKKAWTIFITGPDRRQWGFHTENGWIPHDEFTREHGAP